jgi:hypothetical protein
MSNESKSPNEVAEKSASHTESNEKEHAMSNESKSPNEVAEQNTLQPASPKEDTMQKNTAPESAAGTSAGSTSSEPTKEKRALFSTDDLQRRGITAKKAAAGNTTAEVATAVAAIDDTLDKATAAGNDAQTALGQQETSIAARNGAVEQLAPALKIASAPFKVSDHGWGVLRSWDSLHPWLTAQKLIRGAPTSGFSVPAESMAALVASTNAAKAAADLADTAAARYKTARANYKAAKRQASTAISALLALLEHQRFAKASGAAVTPPEPAVPSGGSTQAVDP